MSHLIYGAKWKCELCGAKGNKYMSSWRARAGYRKHLRRCHPNADIQPILFYKNLDNGKILGGGKDAKYGRVRKESKKIR